MVAGAEGEGAEKRRKPKWSVDMREEPRRNNRRLEKGPSALVIKQNDYRSRGPPTPAKRRLKDGSFPRMLDHGLLEKYVWNPVVSPTHFQRRFTDVFSLPPSLFLSKEQCTKYFKISELLLLCLLFFFS